MAWSPDTAYNFIQVILQSHESSSTQNTITLRLIELEPIRTVSLLSSLNITSFDLITF